MAGEDSEPEKMCSELAGTHFTIGKKNPMKIPEFKRSGIGLIADFCGTLNGFPNQGDFFIAISIATLSIGHFPISSHDQKEAQEL